jgi:hypothetical protein
MQAVHEEGHEGTISTLHRSRKKVWIIGGRSLAETVKARCTEFRLKEKKCMEQGMGPLPNHRVGPGAIFQSVAVDLFRPIEFQGTVNKRQVGKGWGVIFVCTTTSAMHVEFMDTYSTDSFLMALCRFMCMRDTPSQIQSDRGEQLVAASKQVAGWDFDSIVQWAGRKGIEWYLIPTVGQHFNGQAERMIGLIKRQTWRSFEGRKHSHEETAMILQEAAQIINSRPLACNPWAEGRPLCPGDLMLGKAGAGVEQLAGVEAYDDASAKAQEGGAAGDEEGGIPPAKTPRVPNISYQYGAETMMDVQSLKKNMTQKHQECDPKHLYQYIQDVYLLPPNFFLFFSQFYRHRFFFTFNSFFQSY